MSKCWIVLYIFAILATTVLWTSTHTMIPFHDLFQHPSFWWELLVMQGIFISLLSTTLPGGQKVFLFFNFSKGAGDIRLKVIPLQTELLRAHYEGKSVVFSL